jgi:TPR repeat protein
LECNNKEDGIAVTQQDIQKAKEGVPEILYNIGGEYYQKESYTNAAIWFHKAALRDHAEAQSQLGNMYRKGHGVSLDYELAMEWYQKAASAGNINAQYIIGELYYYGEGVREDRKAAMDWYLEAANYRNTDAMNQIGYMYKYGYGVTRSILTAVEWYTKAANQGNAQAQCELGYLYRYKYEVKDLQKAVHWYQMAADHNDTFGAKEKVKELNEQGYYASEQQKGILIACICFLLIIIKNI